MSRRPNVPTNRLATMTRKTWSAIPDEVEKFGFLSTTGFTILSRTIILLGWESDDPRFVFLHDGITFERFKLEG